MECGFYGFCHQEFDWGMTWAALQKAITIFMSKASHDQPHGLWTVIDKREREYEKWVEGGSIY